MAAVGSIFFPCAVCRFLTNTRWETHCFTKHFNIHCRVNSLSRHLEHKRKECHFIVKYRRQMNSNGGSGRRWRKRYKMAMTTEICYLTNRFHFAVRLYSDNAQMTSKRGENKEVGYEPQASSVTDVLTTF